MSQRDLRLALNLAQVGLEMVAPIVLGVVLDLVLGLLPWLTIVGAIFGFCLGMLQLMNLLNKQDEQQKKNSGPPGSTTQR